MVGDRINEGIWGKFCKGSLTGLSARSRLSEPTIGVNFSKELMNFRIMVKYDKWSRLQVESLDRRM